MLLLKEHMYINDAEDKVQFTEKFIILYTNIVISIENIKPVK